LEFAQPYYLLLLLTIPLLGVWYFRVGIKKQASIRFSNINLFSHEAIQKGEWLNRSFIFLKLLIITLLILAISRPRLSDTVKETKTEVIDILLVVDQSSSMLAQDFKPNRLEAAKNVAKTFIKDREGDRLGIIVFAGESYIQCPLTRDTDILLDFTDQIEIIDEEHDGTAIGMAIANATNRLRESESESRIMIFLSDGSNNKGELDPLTAAELASTFGIKIYTVAAGTHGMAPYPTKDMWGRDVLRQVQVDVDEESLKEIARLTEGKFFRATDNKTLKQVYMDINQLEKTEIEVKEYQNITELYSWFIIPATLLLFIYLIFSRIILGKLF